MVALIVEARSSQVLNGLDPLAVVTLTGSTGTGFEASLLFKDKYKILCMATRPLAVVAIPPAPLQVKQKSNARDESCYENVLPVLV